VKKASQNPISVVDRKPGGVRERPVTDPPVSITRCAQPGAPAPGRRAGGGRRYDGGAHRRGARHRASLAVPARRPALVRGRPLLASRVPAGMWLGAGCQARPGPCRADLTGRAECRLDACGPGRQASAPRRPAPGPAVTAPGSGEGAHEVTAWDPAPGPAGLPLRQGRARRAPLGRATGRPGLSSSRRLLSRSPGRASRTAAGRRPGGGRT
jgi:hypothetical protein